MSLSTTIADLWAAAGTAVLHFLWQGALVGAVAYVALALVPRRSSEARHLVALSALAACLLAFGATLFELASTPAPGPLQPEAYLSLLDSVAEPMSATELTATSPGRLPGTVSAIWVLGMALMTVRLGRSWLATRRLLTEASAEVPAAWRASFQELQAQIGLKRGVLLLRSTLAQTPMVLGWLAPVVLVPASAFTALGPAELRAVLLHELAHVRRHDHLVNLMQCLAETLLFFHPVTWWLSSQVRDEREYCCDAAALATDTDRRHLASALAQLEELRQLHPTTSLSANGGPLMNRIRRILEARPTQGQTPGRILGLGAIAALLTVSGLASQGIAGTTAPGMGQERASAEDTITREVYDRAAARVEARIQAGSLSPEKGRRILHELRGRIAGPPDASEQELERRKIEEQLVRAEEQLVLIEEQVVQAEAKRRRDAALDQLRQAEELARKAQADVELQAATAGIQSAVVDGKLTPAEAEEKLQFLRLLTSRAAQVEAEAQAKLRSLQVSVEELEQQVRSGELSKREGALKIEYLKAEQQNPKLDELRRETAFVESLAEVGTITRENAALKLEALRLDHDLAQLELERAMERKQSARVEAANLKELVRAGLLSEEDANRKLAELGKITGAPGLPKDKGADLLEEISEVDKLVEAGVISSREATLKTEALKRSYEAIQLKRSKEADHHLLHGSDLRRLEEALKAGRVDQLQADLRVLELKAKLEAALRKSEESQAAIDEESANIEKLYQAGMLTRAQADLKLRGLQKKLGASHR